MTDEAAEKAWDAREKSLADAEFPEQTDYQRGMTYIGFIAGWKAHGESDNFDPMRSRIAALEAVIRLALERHDSGPTHDILSEAPSVVLDGVIREAKAEARTVQPTDREELFQLWLRHGSSFESDHSEGYELADALLAAGWRKETR